MSLDRVITALTDLGLTRLDAEIYVYLAKKGLRKTSTLARNLNYPKQKIYPSLNKLLKLGLLTRHQSLYSALPFEKALEILINSQRDEEKSLEKYKKELLVNWTNNDNINS